MAQELLNRSGFTSLRNKARPFRPQRIDPKTGKIDQMDNMRLGSKGQAVNSTGCFGVRNSITSVSHLSLVKRTPGRNRSGAKRKAVSRLFPGNQHKEFDARSKIELCQLRNDIMTYKYYLEFSGQRNRFCGDIKDIFTKIDKFLPLILPINELKKLYEADIARYRTVKGMMGKIQFKEIKSLDQRIMKARTILGFIQKGDNNNGN